MGVGRHILVVSSDNTFASLLERELGGDFEIHPAVSNVAANALLDAYSYSCVVADGTVANLRLNELTVPVITLPPERIDVDSIRQVADRVRQAT